MIRTIESKLTDINRAYVEMRALSTDTKPSNYDPTNNIGLATGSIFTEVDTGAVFFFDEASETWVEQFSFQG